MSTMTADEVGAKINDALQRNLHHSFDAVAARVIKKAYEYFQLTEAAKADKALHKHIREGGGE